MADGCWIAGVQRRGLNIHEGLGGLCLWLQLYKWTSGYSKSMRTYQGHKETNGGGKVEMGSVTRTCGPRREFEIKGLDKIKTNEHASESPSAHDGVVKGKPERGGATPVEASSKVIDNRVVACRSCKVESTR
jgi:hypothetical protein